MKQLFLEKLFYRTIRIFSLGLINLEQGKNDPYLTVDESYQVHMSKIDTLSIYFVLVLTQRTTFL